MPGFVDVSTMSDLEVKRLGHRDDVVETQTSRNNSGYRRPPAIQYAVADVWAAACAAQRVNGSYVKEDRHQWDESTQTSHLVARRNRDVMAEFLADTSLLTAEDRQRADAVQTYLRNDLTFRAVKGKLTEFDSAVSRCLAVENNFDTGLHRYELAVVASLPASAERSENRQTVDQRLAWAKGGYLGQPGNKVTIQVEILACVYSQKFDLFWIRGVTDKDQPVMFSSKTKFDAGTWITIRGSVKFHQDNMTRLNYVKVM